jgi:hypothetical protein
VLSVKTYSPEGKKIQKWNEIIKLSTGKIYPYYPALKNKDPGYEF